MNKTYLFGKLGSSLKFNTNCFTAVGGDIEPFKLIISMAKLNPADNFIIISKNNLSNYKDRPSNIFDIHQLYKNKFKIDCNNSDLKVSYIYDYLETIKVDGCIILSGPTGTTNIIDFAYKRKPLKDGKFEYAIPLLIGSLYCAPIYYYLNNSKINWLMINNDPRNMKTGRDCLNPPTDILSQYDFEYVYKHLNSFEDQIKLIETIRQPKYEAIEKIYLIDNKINIDTEKTIKFLIVLNEGNNGVKSRYNELIKYIGDNKCKIYGQWKNKKTFNDNRFVGTIKFEELQDILPSIKYTFIIPIKSGWVTMKFWEMISNGIIPFFHPEYDTQRHLDIPEFLRVNSKIQLENRIQFLEDNPSKYKELLNTLINMITAGDLSGQTINNKIINTLNKYKIDNTNKIQFDNNYNTCADFDLW